MLRSTRTITGVCLLAGISLGAVVGWATGFFGDVATRVSREWNSVTDWLSQPFGWDHVLAGVGVLAVPIILLVVIFAIADD